MATTTYGDISQRTAAWAATEMLAHAEPVLVLSKFGQNKPLPKNKANTVKFRRPIPFALATTPLTEGVTPTARQMQYEDVEAQIAQYGDVVEITDVVADLAEDPVLKDAAMLCGEQAGETIEYLTWGEIRGGTNFGYAASGDTARSDVNDPISIGAIRKAVRALKAQRGRPITQMLSGSPNYNTTPVEGGYVAFAHTDIEADLRKVSGFVPVSQYGSRKPLCPEEIGTVENVRFILSPVLSPWQAAGSATLNGMIADDDTNVDVYPVVFIAREAYGLIPLKGAGAITPSVINPNTASKSDPLGQMGYVGWKTYFVAKRLNEAWMYRLEVGATENPS